MPNQPKVAFSDNFSLDAGQTRLTEHLWKEWKLTNSDLKDLANAEDQAISEGRDISPELDAEIDEAFEMQRKIVLDALSIRSESLEDIVYKLEIWQSLIFGDKTKPHLLQPGDLLIRQTIREFKELRKKT